VETKKGTTVRVHYSGSFHDGTVFDTSKDGKPLEFTIGEGGVIPGFEESIMGMKSGESKTFTLSEDDAYGPHRKELMIEVDKSKFPPEINPEVGQQLEIPQPDGKTAYVVVTDASESIVTLDANHPLAGKELIFQVELIEVKN